MLRSLKKLARGFMIVFTTFFVEIIETLRAESKLRSKLELSCSSVEEDIFDLVFSWFEGFLTLT